MRKNRALQLSVLHNQKLGNINTAVGGWRSAKDGTDETMSLQRGRRHRKMAARKQGKVQHVHMDNAARSKRKMLPHLGCKSCEKGGGRG